MRKTLFVLAIFALAAHAAVAQTGNAPARPARSKQNGAEPKPRPQCGASGEPASVPEKVLDAELKDLSGQTFRLSDFKGRVIVLNFWATWCPPCRREIYDLNVLHTDYAARGVEIIGLTVENQEKDAHTVSTFVQQLGVNYRVGWADMEAFCALSQCDACVPQTFVIAGDGRIVKRLRGFHPSTGASDLREFVEQALSETAKSGQ